MTQILGFLGGMFFAFAAVPSAIRTASAGESIGVPVELAWKILAGVACLFGYLTLLHGFDPIIACTYGLEFASWLVIVWFHYFPRVQRCKRCKHVRALHEPQCCQHRCENGYWCDCWTFEP